MASPFNVFRRNQRIMMAVLTGLSMFAFIFFDVSVMRSGGGMSKSLTVAMFAAICALGLWYVGRRHGKPSEWAMWGALLGGVAAFLFVRSSEPAPAIRAKGINITDNTLRDLSHNRYLANQFVMRAGMVTKAKRASQGFGPADDRSMIQYALGRQEVKRLGISLNDDAVNRYINEITDDKLSKGDFSKILKELNLSSGDLFKILREELEVRLAFEMQAPPYDLWVDFNPQNFQTFFRPKLPATPEEQWEFFQKLNVKQSLSVVALPVASFLPKVPKASETDLKELFDLRKGNTPGQKGEPGFIQPHRVKLGYLAAEFVKFESQVSSPTDDEVAEYYEANKERYQIRDFPESSREDEDRPADAEQPDNVAPELPAPDAPDSESDAKPDEEKKPESKDDDKKPEEKNDRESSSSAIDVKQTGVVRLVSATADDEEKEDKENAAEEKKESKEEKADDKPAAKEEPSDEKPGSEDKKPESDADSEEMPELPPSPGEGDKKKEVRYRPLDDDLRDRIREEILRDRAFEKMGDAVDKARAEMEGLAFKYLEADDADKAKVAADIAGKLKAYAADHDLEYVETPLLSQLELQTSTTESIGMAVLPASGPMQFQSPSVVDDLFPRTGQTSPLYFPQRADSRLRDRRYAWWKIEDKPQHVPAWSDEGIPDQVRTAWNYEQARKLAQQRAEQLHDVVTAAPEDFAAALAGQTVTGDSGTTSVVIKETPRFSWLTTNLSVAFDPEMGDFLAPRRSFVDGVDRPGDDFMKTVFDELKNGEAGIAANADRSTFFLVKVRDRDGTEPPADVEGFQTLDTLRNQFVSSLGSQRAELAHRPYNLMMFNMFSRVQQEWTKKFDQRYGVEFDDMQEASAPPRSRRRR